MAVRTLLAAGWLLLVCTACGQVQEDAVASAADTFRQARHAGDGAAACAVLAPRTRTELSRSAGRPCPEAVLEEKHRTTGKPMRTQIFGTQAIVSVGEDTMFLSRFPDGWKVTAAGCTPRRGLPYDCVISGG